MAKGNVCHYIGQTKPVDHLALWIRVEVNHIHRMIFRLKAAVFVLIVLKKLLQSEFIFIFLNRRETDINFESPLLHNEKTSSFQQEELRYQEVCRYTGV